MRQEYSPFPEAILDNWQKKNSFSPFTFFLFFCCQFLFVNTFTSFSHAILIFLQHLQLTFLSFSCTSSYFSNTFHFTSLFFLFHNFFLSPLILLPLPSLSSFLHISFSLIISSYSLKHYSLILHSKFLQISLCFPSSFSLIISSFFPEHYSLSSLS